MANEFHIRVIKLAKYEELRPAAYGVLSLSGKMLDPEEYEHFVYTFRQFKNRLGDDQDGATLLRECLGTDVSRILYSNFGAALGSFTEEQILTNITRVFNIDCCQRGISCQECIVHVSRKLCINIKDSSLLRSTLSPMCLQSIL